MASLKFGVIICALFVLQTQAFPQQQYTEGGALDVIKKIVNVTERVIDRALVLGIHVSEKLIEIADNTPAQNEKIAKKIIDFTGNIADKFLDRLRDKVNDDAKIGLDCVELHKNEWRQARLDLVVNFTMCSSQELAKTITELKAILSDLQDIQGDAKTAASEIDNCNGELTDPSTLICVLKVTSDLVNVAKKVPDVVKDDVSKLIEIIKANAKHVVECAKGEVKDFYYNDYIRIMNEVAGCIRKK